ncbi:MAG: hypothetical protein M0Z46_20895 [Actinomycetota bacterium]|nr:hypothetical protein [Actinomycetota bacterium]
MPAILLATAVIGAFVVGDVALHGPGRAPVVLPGGRTMGGRRYGRVFVARCHRVRHGLLAGHRSREDAPYQPPLTSVSPR